MVNCKQLDCVNSKLFNIIEGLCSCDNSCYAWSFMTNYAHFLFRSGESGLAKIMRRLLAEYVVDRGCKIVNKEKIKLNE